MVKIAPLANITAGNASAAKINDAFDKIEDAFDNTLSRDGSGPNAMQADLDLNGNDILNAGSVSAGQLILGGVTQTTAALVPTGAEIVLDTVASMKAYTSLISGNRVRTLGYWAAYDGGGAEYIIKTNAAFGSTPDNLIDHAITGNTLVAELQHNLIFNLQACGVREGVESSEAWNNGVWRAASYAAATLNDEQQPVKVYCNIDVITNKTLHLSKEPTSEFTSGARIIMDVIHPGNIIAVGGGTFESHLNNEMSRLSTLHGSSVTLGSELAAKFLKADPQVAEFLGNKIERPLPIIAMSVTRGNLEFGDINCDFWCSGIRVHRCSISRIWKLGMVRNFRKYGLLYTKNTNNDVKTYNPTVKQWGQGDFTSHGGRMMPTGYLEPKNFTGDGIVICQKDMMFFGGNTGWSRAAVVTLDKCEPVEDDRWAGRTIYPDYFTRWDDVMWEDHGGSINQPEWDYMTPSTGSGDCNFYSMHVMQGSAETADEEQVFRMDGLDFGGQTGFENWSSTNPVNVYGADIDSSVTQLFGSGIRFYGPTITVGNSAKHGCFHPVMRMYAARQGNGNFTEFENWGGSIGVFPFDRGDVGAPNVVSYGGSFQNWNYRNRVDSGSWTGPVTYRGTISGGTGNLPSGSVVAAGDFFWVIQDGTYGGQVMNKGDILYALTTSPGTSYGVNWHLGENQDVASQNGSKTVGVSKFLNTLIANETSQPILWVTKPSGDAGIRLETGLTQYDLNFDGTDVSYTTDGDHKFFGSLILRRGATGLGYGVGTGASVEQGTSRSTGVTINNPTGSITLVSAAGSTSWTSFLVTNSTVTAQDTIILSQRTGTDDYELLVTAVNAGSFRISYRTTGGTTTEQPIFNFTLIRGSNN